MSVALDGLECHFYEDKPNKPAGRCALSVKLSIRKRRVLITGHMEVTPVICRCNECGSKLKYEFIFKPNDPNKWAILETEVAAHHNAKREHPRNPIPLPRVF